MKLNKLKQMIACGEDSSQQFKQDIKSPDSLAAEMVAFSNSQGGILFIGVADNGELTGLNNADIARINQLISNTASQHIKSPISVQTENIALENNKIVIVLTIQEGIDKPYFDNKGVIWLKNGADKRRLTSKEELRRIFQSVDLIHADEIPLKAGIEALDKIRFRDFFQMAYKESFPETDKALMHLLSNMNLADDSGKLNLAGVLLFAQKPELIKPAFIVKAVRYPGNDISASQFIDSEDFSGPFDALFKNSLAFIMRNLHKQQVEPSVNSPGKPEIPEAVFEELLVNALVHRDYFISASIRLFIFDDRIEIISPGHLPNHLTVEKIRSGNSNIRNSILASYVAKGLLPYKGLGSGIQRALQNWPDIYFTDDRQACTFTSTINRNASVNTKSEPVKSKNAPVNAPVKDKNAPVNKETTKISDLQVQIISLIHKNSKASYDEMAITLNKNRTTIMRNIQKLKDLKKLQRIGSDKSGYWKLIN